MQQAEHLVDYCCGFISGVVQVIVMQPFEIVKVRLVNQSLLHPEYAGIWDCCMKIRREEGLLTFYKGTLQHYLGTLSPLLGVCAQVSLQFGSNEQIKKILKSLFDLE